MNFYELTRDTEHYPSGWCNWTQTMAAYCPGAAVSVRYFTSRYIGSLNKRKLRQDLHLRAMEEVAGADIVYGAVRPRSLSCSQCGEERRCRCGTTGRLVEKMTDVNIAVCLLEDAVDSKFDRAYIVSADVDLLPAVRAALKRAPQSQIFVLFPPGAVKAADFTALELEHRGRAKCEYLDMGKMRRFPDDLPKLWNMRLPDHWRADAGKRPGSPDHHAPPMAKKPVPSWVTESAGYGSNGSQCQERMHTRQPSRLKSK